MSRAQNADVGAAGEERATEWLSGLELVDDHDDHRVDGHLVEPITTEIGATEATITVAPAGTPVECKTVALWKRGGGCLRRGELHIRRRNHEHLSTARASTSSSSTTATVTSLRSWSGSRLLDVERVKSAAADVDESHAVSEPEPEEVVS